MKRDLVILAKFQELLKQNNNFGSLMLELNNLVPPIHEEHLCLKSISGIRYGPGNLFTWLVMNGIVIDPREVLKKLKCSIEIEDGILGLAGPVSVPFFQPNLITFN
jgi:hypothetical protein